MTTEDTEEWPDSGPFCKHWSDFDCEEKCAECGHSCNMHGWGFEERHEDGCQCKMFKDAS